MMTSKLLFAGKATFTAANPEGERHTFKIYQTRKMRKETPHQFTCYTKSGHDFKYLGNIDYNRGNNTFKFSTPYPENKDTRIFLWAVNTAVTKTILPEGYELLHEGFCPKCGKVLHVVESIKKGIGPICDHNKLDENHVRTKLENEIFTAVTNYGFQDLVDVYAGTPSSPEFGYCARVVFKDGDDIYANFNRDETMIGVITSEMMKYRMSAFIK